MNQLKMYRCIKLLELLQQKPRHLQTISRYLNVSQRTVYRYFKLFNSLGYTISKDNYNKFMIYEKSN